MNIKTHNIIDYKLRRLQLKSTVSLGRLDYFDKSLVKEIGPDKWDLFVKPRLENGFREKNKILNEL